jgi:hypothetical protein
MQREHIENLNPGDFIVVTGVVSDLEATNNSNPYEFNPFGFQPPRQRHIFDGHPLRVIHANDPPFLIVTNGTALMPLDIREFIVSKVSREYVELFLDRTDHTHKPLDPQPRKRRPKSLALIPSKQRKRKEKPDPSACPRCGKRMTLIRRQNTPGWFIYCSECDMDYGEAK